jgi:hypothetical protein
MYANDVIMSCFLLVRIFDFRVHIAIDKCFIESIVDFSQWFGTLSHVSNVTWTRENEIMSMLNWLMSSFLKFDRFISFGSIKHRKETRKLHISMSDRMKCSNQCLLVWWSMLMSFSSVIMTNRDDFTLVSRHQSENSAWLDTWNIVDVSKGAFLSNPLENSRSEWKFNS